jgi:hypothetical protein
VTTFVSLGIILICVCACVIIQKKVYLSARITASLTNTEEYR